VFEDDLKRSRQITYEEWANRPLKEKFMERLALLLESQLWQKLRRRVAGRHDETASASSCTSYALPPLPWWT